MRSGTNVGWGGLRCRWLSSSFQSCFLGGVEIWVLCLKVSQISPSPSLSNQRALCGFVSRGTDMLEQVSEPHNQITNEIRFSAKNVNTHKEFICCFYFLQAVDWRRMGVNNGEHTGNTLHAGTRHHLSTVQIQQYTEYTLPLKSVGHFLTSWSFMILIFFYNAKSVQNMQ